MGEKAIAQAAKSMGARLNKWESRFKSKGSIGADARRNNVGVKEIEKGNMKGNNN